MFDKGTRVAPSVGQYASSEGKSVVEASSYEAAARLLDGHDDYQVLRRLRPRVVRDRRPLLPGEAISIVVDTETTGLDPARDEIIQIGMIAFVHDASGSVIDVVGVFDAFREPSVPIGPDITRLTGITPAMVTGCTIDVAEVETFIAEAHIIVAHNASFDRPFLENFACGYSRARWACSLKEVPWASRGTKLPYLLSERGRFFEAHRAIDDCHALLEVLAAPFHLGGTALSFLLRAAARTDVRIWAEGAPFHRKEVLKSRHYRWNDGVDGRSRAWFVDLEEGRLAEEISFLQRVVYQRSVLPRTEILTARERYKSK